MTRTAFILTTIAGLATTAQADIFRFQAEAFGGHWEESSTWDHGGGFPGASDGALISVDTTAWLTVNENHHVDFLSVSGNRAEFLQGSNGRPTITANRVPAMGPEHIILDGVHINVRSGLNNVADRFDVINDGKLTISGFTFGGDGRDMTVSGPDASFEIIGTHNEAWIGSSLNVIQAGTLTVEQNASMLLEATAQIGRSSGTRIEMYITSGASLDASNDINIGAREDNTPSQATLTITGSGSRMTLAGGHDITLGNGDPANPATLKVEQGAELNVISDDSTLRTIGGGLVHVRNADLNLPGDLDIEGGSVVVQGSGVLDVDGQARFSDDALLDIAGGIVIVNDLVFDSGSDLEFTSGELRVVGPIGSGLAHFDGVQFMGGASAFVPVINLAGGNDITFDGNWNLGQHVGDTARMTISGHMESDRTGFVGLGEFSNLKVGFHGNGELTVDSGAEVVVGSVDIAAFGISTGTVTVTGQSGFMSSRLVAEHDITIGGVANQAGGTGHLTISDGARVETEERLRVFSGSTVELNGGTLIADDVSFDNPTSDFDFNGGTMHTRSFHGNLFSTGSGTTSPGIPGTQPLSTLNISGGFINGNAATVRLELGGTTPGTHDKLVIAGGSTLGGTLSVTMPGSYWPQPGDTIEIISALNVSGTFQTTNLPSGMEIIYEQNRVLLSMPIATCGADIAPPVGVLDVFDVLAYLTLFDAQDPAADLAAPSGVLDVFDVIEYLALFDGGCT